jgi:hypothetical protein
MRSGAVVKEGAEALPVARCDRERPQQIACSRQGHLARWLEPNNAQLTASGDPSTCLGQQPTLSRAWVAHHYHSRWTSSTSDPCTHVDERTKLIFPTDERRGVASHLRMLVLT